MGATKAEEVSSSTIRGDFAQYTGKNLVHGSDGPERSARNRYFLQYGELVDYNLDTKTPVV